MKTLIITIAILIAAINLNSQEPIWKVRNPSGVVSLDAKISSDNNYIYVASECCIWKQDFNTGIHLDTLSVNYGTLYSLALLEDSLLFVGGGFPDQKPVKVINLKDTTNTLNNININIPRASIASYNIHLNKQKRHLFINLIKGAAIYDINTNEIIKTFGIEDEKAWHSVGKFSGDGRFLYVSNNKRIIKYDANNYEQIGGIFYESFDTRVKDIDVNFDGSLVAIAYDEKVEVYVVNATGTVAAYNPPIGSIVYDLQFLDDNYLFISNSWINILNITNNSYIEKKIGSLVYDFNSDKTKMVCIVTPPWHLALFNISDIITSIENTGQEVDNIFPNPTNGTVNINYTVNAPSIFNIEVFNTNGIMMFHEPLGLKDIGVHNHIFNTIQLPIGSYRLKISSPLQIINFNLIKGE